MDPITREKLAGNAYRTLGLSGSSSQSVIEAAARRMRIWPDPSRVPPTPWDWPALGPIRRSKPDIEQAVAMLNQPLTRLEHRLLWFGGDRPPEETTNAHAAAILELQSAWSQEESADDRWSSVIRQISEACKAPQLGGWMREVEQAGQFDKRASEAEITDAIAQLPAAVAAGVVRKAAIALDQGKLTTVIAIATAIRQVPAPPRKIHPADDLLDKLEDLFNARCEEMDKVLRDNLRINHSAPDGFYAANYVHARRGAQIYDSKVMPTMSALMSLSADDNDRLIRLKSRCGKLLVLLALGWEWSGRMVAAEQQLQEALKVSAGTVTELEVRRELDRVAPLAALEKKKSAYGSLIASRIPRSKPAAAADQIINPAIKPKKPRGKKTVGWKGSAWVLGILGSTLVRLFVSSSSSSLTSTPQPEISLPYSNPMRPLQLPHQHDPLPIPGQFKPLPAENPRTSVGDDFREP